MAVRLRTGDGRHTIMLCGGTLFGVRAAATLGGPRAALHGVGGVLLWRRACVGRDEGMVQYTNTRCRLQEHLVSFRAALLCCGSVMGLLCCG